MAQPVPGFSDFEFTDGGITHTVYRRGTGRRAVLLMHELPGMTPACIGYANELADTFTVFMPLLFGAPNDDKGVAFIPQLCISREFNLFANGGGSPVVNWLRALGRHALAACGGPASAPSACA
jgi:dienelactone hydrolase